MEEKSFIRLTAYGIPKADNIQAKKIVYEGFKAHYSMSNNNKKKL